MPEDVFNELVITDIFRPPGDDKAELFVVFEDVEMTKKIYQYARKMNGDTNLFIYIPQSFQSRWEELNRVAYELRHATPAYRTKIRWGYGDLILERKLKNYPKDKYRMVTVTDLPPVNLNPSVTNTRPAPTSSPAPGRKQRRKRTRMEDSQENLSPQHKISKQRDEAEDTTVKLDEKEAATNDKPDSGLDNGFFHPSEFVSPANTSLSRTTSKPSIRQDF